MSKEMVFEFTKKRLSINSLIPISFVICGELLKIAIEVYKNGRSIGLILDFYSISFPLVVVFAAVSILRSQIKRLQISDTSISIKRFFRREISIGIEFVLGCKVVTNKRGTKNRYRIKYQNPESIDAGFAIFNDSFLNIQERASLRSEINKFLEKV